MIVRHFDRVIIGALLCLVFVILWLLLRLDEPKEEVAGAQPVQADGPSTISHLGSIPVHVNKGRLFTIGGPPLSCASDSELGEWDGSERDRSMRENLSPKDFSIRSAHAEIDDSLLAIHINVMNVSAQVRAWPLFRTLVLSDRGALLADFTRMPIDYDYRWLPGCNAAPQQLERIVFVHDFGASIGSEISVFIGVCSYPREGGRIDCVPNLDELSPN